MSIAKLSAVLAGGILSLYLGAPSYSTVMGAPPTQAAAQPVEQQGFAAIQHRDITAVILGDSISVSRGASCDEASWASDVQRYFDSHYHNDINWVVKGLSGTTVDYSLQRSEELTSDLDCVFICVGRNDRNVYSPTEFKAGYIRLIENIRAKSPNADVFCIIEPPMATSDDSSFNKIRDALINIPNATVLDVWSAFPTSYGALRPLTIDTLHLTDEGYRIMANSIVNDLRAKLHQTSCP